MQGLVNSMAGARRYIVERELGHGGMGVVYQVLDLERNTHVALKALSKIDAVNIYRLKNEFRQLADLSHPNLVSLHELHCENELWFFTMELVVGETFDVYVSAESTLLRLPDRALQTTLAGRARIVRDASVTLSQDYPSSEFPRRLSCNLNRLRASLRQLVAAVGAIHDADKLHRDIKPSNVLVTEAGRVVVLDFGLVASSTLVESNESAGEHTIGGAVFGTPAYMSPEQAAGESVSKASDWYSVGCMLYEALTGQLPFEGTVLEILKRKDETEPPAPSEVVRGVPEDLNDLCCALLRRRPEDRPTSAELQRMFLTSSLPPTPLGHARKAPSHGPGELFIGREPHLAALRAAFEGVKARQPATVFVHGHSGMGKSALVRCFANELIKNQEALVLRGRCYERESVPYKAFDDIVDALGRHMMRLPTEEASELLPRNIHALAHLFPVLRRVRAVAHARLPLHVTSDPQEIRQQAFGALKDLLARLSDWQPLVVTIDDLQWGDMDSARLLTHLLGPPDPPPILFIAVYRRDEAETSPFLRTILYAAPLEGGIANVQHLAVDPLATDEAAHLARELLRDQPLADPSFVRSISSESEGVPFFISELAQHVKAHAHELNAPLASVSLDGVIADRAQQLSAGAQRLLEVLSVAARPLEQGVALEAADIPGDREALLTLRAARLIRTRGTRLTDHAETYHDRVREAITAGLSADRIREIHARVARASEVWGVGEPEQLVVHYTEAGEGGRAGETAVHAARSAANKLAFNRAAELFRKAIELIDPTDQLRRRELHEELGDALSNSGRGCQAAEAYLEAAAAGSGWEASTLRRKAATQFLRSGRVEEGMRLVEQLLAEVGVAGLGSNARVVTKLLWNKSLLRLSTFRVAPANDPVITQEQERQLEMLASAFREISAVDNLRGSFLHSQFLRAAIKAAEPSRVLEGLAWEAMHLAYGHGVKAQQRVERLLRRSDELANQLGTYTALATAKLARAACYIALARFREGYPLARDAERMLRDHCPGTYWERSVVMTLRYACVEIIGSLREIADEAYDRAREASERDDGFSRAYLGVYAHLGQLMQGDAEGALRALQEERKALGKEFTTFHLWVMSRSVDAYNYLGQGARAWELLATEWRAYERSSQRFVQLYNTNAQYLFGRTAVAAYLETGVRDRLRDAHHAHAQLLRLSRPDAQLYAHFVGAGIARAEDSGAKQHEELSAALQLARAHGYETFALYAQHCLARVDATAAARRAGEEADATLRAQGVVDPRAWIAVYAPGLC